MSDPDAELLSLVEQGSYSAASAILARKIKKFPQRSFYYAVNNQILYKQGKLQQALTNNTALLAKAPNDPQTVGLLYEFFSEFSDPKDPSADYSVQANQVYENVIKKYPSSASTATLLLDWFDRVIPQYNWKVYNKVFTSLHKNTKSTDKNRLHTLWNAFVYLQLVTVSQNPKEAALYNALGLKLVESLAPWSAQERFVYLGLLKANKEFEKIVEVIVSSGDSSSQDLDLDLDTQLVYVEALLESENWERLHLFTQNLLFKKDFNDFDTWKLFIQSGQEALTDSYSEIEEAIKGAKVSRNSVLALVELAFVSKKSYPEAVVNYFKTYNHKMCCFQDLKYYLSQEPYPELYQEVLAVKDEVFTTYKASPSSVNDLIRLINVQKLTYYLEPEKSPQFISDFIETNWKIHALVPADLAGEFDNNPANELALLSIVLSLNQDSSNENIIKSIIILSKLIESDKHNHNLKLWLIKLHANLNTNNSVPPIYQSLKIKMLQHETLGHLLIPTNPSKQHLEDLITIFRFYLTSNDEIKSSIQRGFESGVYTKLASFVNFGARISNSVSRLFVITSVLKFSVVLSDTGYVTYFTKLLSKECDSLLQIDNFQDNRDFTTEWKAIGGGEEILDLGNKPFGLNLPTSNLLWTSNEIKLSILKYVLLFSDSFNSPSAVKHLKQYNNAISSPDKPVLKFDILVYKLTFNLFKLFKQKSNEVDEQSTVNFLVKNLKFDKLKNLLVPENLLSWELNHNLVNLVELIRIARLLVGQSRTVPAPTVNTIKTTIEQLVKDLKDKKLISRQLEELKKTQEDFKISELPIGESDITQTFKTLHDSITESAVFLNKL